MLLTCLECGTHQDYSIMEGDVVCPECGADSDSLVPIRESVLGDASDSRHTVLLAEDDDDLRESYRLWLDMDEGEWEVREADDGADVLERIDETVDVLVLDRRMPNVSGAEVVAQLPETPFEGDVLVISAYTEDEHLSESGVAAYLTKPVRQETFRTVLKRVVHE